jgi:hypothetical protein
MYRARKWNYTAQLEVQIEFYGVVIGRGGHMLRFLLSTYTDKK